MYLLYHCTLIMGVNEAFQTPKYTKDPTQKQLGTGIGFGHIHIYNYIHTRARTYIYMGEKVGRKLFKKGKEKMNSII